MNGCDRGKVGCLEDDSKSGKVGGRLEGWEGEGKLEE